jgi:myo-inositol-1(or 4)-monophosphatase
MEGARRIFAALASFADLRKGEDRLGSFREGMEASAPASVNSSCEGSVRRDMDPQQALSAAISAARSAGRVLRNGVTEKRKGASTKANRNDLVTAFDRKAEQGIVQTLSDRFPEYGIIAEEGTRKATAARYSWIVDPLDGTNNFLRGIPHFAVSIALVVERSTCVACVYDPIRDELFTAIRGEGAFVDGRPAVVSRLRSLGGAVVGVDFSNDPERRTVTHSVLPKLYPQVRALRALGSAALDLAYVACGRLDAMWYPSLCPWDVAAGALLVVEAGGAVTNPSGGALTDPRQGVLASNGRNHSAMVRALSRTCVE